MQLHWHQGELVQGVWVAVAAQVLHSHLWVRGAAARLLGLAFADSSIGTHLPPLPLLFWTLTAPSPRTPPPPGTGPSGGESAASVIKQAPSSIFPLQVFSLPIPFPIPPSTTESRNKGGRGGGDK